jgi:hypothetical protein
MGTVSGGASEMELKIEKHNALKNEQASKN